MPHVELPQAEFKVCMLGDANTGKTSLVLRFAEGYYRDAPRSSTVGAFFITKRIQTSTGITCKIQIWDTAGQAQFRPMAPMYYRTAAAAIVCYDVTDVRSYKVLRDWLDELHRSVPAGSIVIAIAATKCDLIRDGSPAVSQTEAEQLAHALGAIYVETSSKDNSGVTELFQRVAERVLRFRQNGTKLPVTPGATVEDGKVVNGNGFSPRMNNSPMYSMPMGEEITKSVMNGIGRSNGSSKPFNNDASTPISIRTVSICDKEGDASASAEDTKPKSNEGQSSVCSSHMDCGVFPSSPMCVKENVTACTIL